MRGKALLKKLIIILSVLLVLSAAGYFLVSYLTTTYEVKNVYVDGSVHYTDEEIKDLVMTGKLGHNSLYLSYKYKDKEIGDIPFVETISVTIESKDTIRINVYEKALAGYIEFLGKYIYFDKDGIVVESSDVITKGVPEVVGIDFDYVVLHEPLPTKDSELFSKVLNITKLMTKYNVFAEKMYFTKGGDTILYKGDITINLGNDDNLDLKILNLPSLLENLEGMKGTLKLENYNEETKRVTFEKSNDSK